MSRSSQVEIERKYDVSATTRVPDLIGAGTIAVVEAVEVIDLDAIYYDTDELHLARNRVALRRREGGADAGWHIKIKRPEAEGRTELRWPIGPAEVNAQTAVVPAEVQAEVEALTAGHPLRAVARISNRRENRRLLDAAGYPVAELSDDHVRAENLIDASTREWREWEVELLAAAPDTRTKRTALLDAIEAILLPSGAVVSPSSSKLARALGVDEATS
ncbi:MAG: CYTH domain-containing protein [Microbacteriaceae bacterium]|nr:MAG: CYTH domain-containing protein [Microbacteriaceae bacterium]